MIVIDQPHDLSADDEARLVPYVDGRLDAEERSSVEARAASDPSFAAALALQQEGRDVIATAAESTGAPLARPTRVGGPARPRAPAPRSRPARLWMGSRRRAAGTGTAGRPHAPGSGGSDGRVRGWWP